MIFNGLINVLVYLFNFLSHFWGGTSLLKFGGGDTHYSILVYNLAGLGEIYDNFSNVYTYEYIG